MNNLNKQILADDRVLAELVRRLLEAFHPERIFLFGSKARGEAGPDSDYDLLVLVGDEATPERRRSRLAYQALRGTGTAADVLVRAIAYSFGMKCAFLVRLHRLIWYGPTG